MNTKIWIILSLCVVSGIGFVLPTSAAEPIDTVRLYLQALQDGDLEVLQNCLGDPLYSRKKGILTKNAQYREFLRTFYKDAEFRIENKNLDQSKDGNLSKRLVEVIVEFPDGNQSFITLEVVKDPTGSWKIVNEK